MGRRKTIVTTLNQNMMDMGEFTYSGKLAMNEWIWTPRSMGVSLDEEDISDYFIEYHQNSLPKKWDKLYRWAEKPDRYFYKLPISTLINDPDNQYVKATERHLKSEYGEDIEVIAGNIAEEEYYYTAWQRLVEQYGYDSETNELTVFSKQYNTPCYLKDGHLVLSQETLDDFYEIGFDNPTLSFNFNTNPILGRTLDIDREQTEYAVNGDDNKDKVIFSYVYEVFEVSPDTGLPVKVIKEESIFIDLSDINPELQEGDDITPTSEYVYLTYKKGNKYYWYGYELGSNKIPSIDNATSSNKGLGQFYPRIYIKHDSKENYNHADTPRKKATLKALKIMGLDAEEITKSMADSIGGEYGNVRSIYIHMGVRLNTATDDNVIAEYCYRYFHRLLHHYPQDEPNIIQAGSIKVSDLVSWQEFNWDSIKLEEHTGVISNSTKPLEVNEFCMKLGTSQVSYTKRKLGIFKSRKRRIVYHHVFYHQVEANKYISLTVIGLRCSNRVSGYTATFTGNDANLVIPIDRGLIFDLTKKEREYLYHHGMSINLLHVKVVKKKWYQTGLFKALLFVAGVAISVMTSGVAAKGVLAVAKAIAVSTIKGVLLTLAIQVAIKLAVKVGLSPTHVAIIAFVATIIVGAYGNGGFNFSKILTAPNMMKALNTSFGYYQKMLAVQIQDIQKQMNDIFLEYQNKAQRLKETQKLLDTKVFEIHHELLRSSYTPQVNLFETVEMFYSRHNSYNVIEVSHGLITNYVDGSLNQKKSLYYPETQNVEDVLLIQS